MLQGKYLLNKAGKALIPWDILWLVSRMGQSGRRNAVSQFFSGKNACYDILSWKDPLPVIGASALWISYAREILSGRLTITGERH